MSVCMCVHVYTCGWERTHIMYITYFIYHKCIHKCSILFSYFFNQIAKWVGFLIPFTNKIIFSLWDENIVQYSSYPNWCTINSDFFFKKLFKLVSESFWYDYSNLYSFFISKWDKYSRLIRIMYFFKKSWSLYFL